MSKPVLHYDDWDGGTEADTDHPDSLICGTESGDPLLTQYKDQVTCKRCLKALADEAARIAAEDMAMKAAKYDELSMRANSFGYWCLEEAVNAAVQRVKP